MKPWSILVLLVGAIVPRPVSAADASRPVADHWAFRPIADPVPPAVADAAWCRTSVDRFVRRRWEEAGIEPAPAADRRTLIRRATFGLTGMPPTAEEVDAFLADASPRAWERLIDRLLESPRYGEHWGRHWLDVVRYADTAGETADYPVPVAWRYRNYVIDAFNADKPYDEFLREQIAGDILAREGSREKYAERVTATGYLAISRRFGFDSENYHHLTLQDTIDTLGQSVLGLTLGCARCHEHKYDPIPMEDYYALYGIFESTRYAFPGSEQKQKHRALVPLRPPAESGPGWQAFEARIADLGAAVARGRLPVPAAVLRSLDELDGDFEMQAPAAGGSKGVLVPPWVYEGPIAVATEAQSPFRNRYPLGRVGATVAAGTHTYRIGQALPATGARPGDRTFHVNLDFRVETNAAPEAPTRRHRFSLAAASSAPMVEVLIAADAVAVRVGDREQPVRSLVAGAWHSLQLVLDLQAGTVAGSVGRPGDVVSIPAWRLARPVGGGPFGAPAFVVLEAEAGAAVANAGLPGMSVDNLAVQGLPLLPVSADPMSLASLDAGTPEGPPVAGGGKENSGAGETDLAKRAEAAKRELEGLLAEGPFELAYAVSEGTPRDARLQKRGEPDRPGEEIRRGFPAVLGGGPLPPGTTGSGRRELAEWLTRPDHPLTARVMVNRIWQYHFGQGLVTTPNDFGTRGRRPADPTLLDHLAMEFVQGGWSIKAMHRLLLASATYQQQSRFAPETGPAAAPAAPTDVECPALPTVAGRSPAATAGAGAGEGTADPFTPFVRRRLGAEETRDAILYVSGGLDPTPGQGHPFPPPTGWGYTQHGPFAAVYEHRRRSVYLMTQRIQRHPFLALFDGPDPNASTAERRTTVVPTQALFFLNDPFVHANAERFADRILAAGDAEARRIEMAFRLALGRSPSPEEREEAAAFLAAYRAALAGSRAETAAEAAVAAADRDPDREAHAALARVLFGSNEFLSVD
jgi:hypothetical protein